MDAPKAARAAARAKAQAKKALALVKKAVTVSNRFKSDWSLRKYVRSIRSSARAASGEVKWAAWWQHELMPAFANASNAAYAIRRWKCWEVCEVAGTRAIARGASLSVMLRAENVAWRTAYPAYWHEVHKDGATPRQARMRKWSKMSEEERLSCAAASGRVDQCCGPLGNFGHMCSACRAEPGSVLRVHCHGLTKTGRATLGCYHGRRCAICKGDPTDFLIPIEMRLSDRLRAQ